jgi:NTE family protein
MWRPKNGSVDNTIDNVSNNLNYEYDNKNNGVFKSRHNIINNNYLSPLGTNFDPSNWTYIYDHTSLKYIIEKYIDFRNTSHVRNEWQNNGEIDSTKDICNHIDSGSKDKNNTRLIVTAANVMASEPLIFDFYKMAVRSEHLLACCGYPLYGFPWIEIEKGVYGWDGGSLLNNTSLREVIQALSKNDKNVFIVENYPQKIDKISENMVEVLDRASDIILSDKTEHTIRLSKIITRQILLIEKLYEVFERTDNISDVDSEKSARIKKEYNKLIRNYGAEILSINWTSTNRIETSRVLKNANFSPHTVRGLMDEDEREAAAECLNNSDITL